VIHETVQIPAGAGQTLAEVVGGHFQDVGPDRVAGAEDRAEREDQPLLAVQAEQHPHRAAIFGFFHQKRHLNGHGVWIGQVEVGRALDGSAIVGERSSFASRPTGASC
jgi:hypothetical protein